MRLAIADPPYPPQVSERVDEASPRTYTRSRARRWYGDGSRPHDERPSDFHADAGDWDDPARHRALLEQLLDEYDGWVIATSPDGMDAYAPLPEPCRRLVWVRPNAIPGGHRIRSMWEAVILYPPVGRRNRRGGQVRDVLIAPSPTIGFPGAKPSEWTHWVLDALGHDAAADTVDDLFPGSGSVAAALRAGAPEPLFSEVTA